MNKKRLNSRVKVELSGRDATYIQGMLAAYKISLELNKKRGEGRVAQELEMARKIEKKFLFA